MEDIQNQVKILETSSDIVFPDSTSFKTDKN